jgi:glycine cleavage system H protein
MQVDKYTLDDGLLYDKHNNWIRIQADIATFGITEVGVKLARDIAYVELPKKEAQVTKAKACGAIESAKWAGDIIAPVSGAVIEVNDILSDDPTVMNKDPYGKGWIAKIRMADKGETDALMKVAAAAEWVRKEVLKS